MADHLIVYIKKEIANDFTTKIKIDEFHFMKDRCCA
jgi:hypothetical protein